ncbi:MAG: DUF4019 domain-containing protein [Acidobacteriota bacterium]|nr:DUF4019 domain-containing protein [Acidobacteriota bacterium]
MKRQLTGWLLVPSVVLLCTAGLVAAGTPEDDALKAAEIWLELVDEGKYSESWDGAAKLFRSAVTRQEWEKSLTGVRSPLGRVGSRKVTLKQYSTSLPGAPDGEYVVLQFETSFENKSKAVETVTPMKDSDGTWRVSGYYIR